MKKMILGGSLLLLFLIGFVPAAQSQIVGQGKGTLGINAGYAMPLGNLAERYAGTPTFDGRYTYGISDRLGVEVRLTYEKYRVNASKSNQRTIQYVINTIPRTFAMPPNLVQFTNLGGVTSSMTYGLLKNSSIKPYIIAGVGMYRYDTYRGSAVPWVALYNPGDPNYVTFHNDYDPVTKVKSTPYPSKHITNWAWGFNGGVGAVIPLGESVSIDIKARYETVLGDLWGVLYFGMEQVRPIQNLLFTGGLNFNL